MEDLCFLAQGLGSTSRHPISVVGTTIYLVRQTENLGAIQETPSSLSSHLTILHALTHLPPEFSLTASHLSAWPKRPIRLSSPSFTCIRTLFRQSKACQPPSPPAPGGLPDWRSVFRGLGGRLLVVRDYSPLPGNSLQPILTGSWWINTPAPSLLMRGLRMTILPREGE